MKPIELFEKNPLTTKKIQDWYMDKMLKSFKNSQIDDDFKEHLYKEGISLEKLSVFLEIQPRGFFDVFDANDIIVLINYHPNVGFTWVVDDEADQLGYDLRKDAEAKAIEMAFSMLENKLIKEITVN